MPPLLLQWRHDKEKHRLKPGGLHTGPDNWNKWWRDFWRRYPENVREPSIDEVMDYLEEMGKHFGLDW